MSMFFNNKKIIENECSAIELAFEAQGKPGYFKILRLIPVGPMAF